MFLFDRLMVRLKMKILEHKNHQCKKKQILRYRHQLVLRFLVTNLSVIIYLLN